MMVVVEKLLAQGPTGTDAAIWISSHSADCQQDIGPPGVIFHIILSDSLRHQMIGMIGKK